MNSTPPQLQPEPPIFSILKLGYLPCSHCHEWFTRNELEFVATRGILCVPYCKVDYHAFYANSQQGKFISFNKAKN